MPDVFVEDGSGLELGDFGILGLGTDAIAFPTRDLGLVFAFTSPPLSRVSSLLARKLAVLAKVLMSSTACSRLPPPEDFSITSIRRRSSLRSSIAVAPDPARLGPAKDRLGMTSTGLQKTAVQIFAAVEPISDRCS